MTHPFIEGYETQKWTSSGKFIGVQRMAFMFRLSIGDEFSVNDFWCYTTRAAAMAAFEVWNGEGDPPDGWVRNGKSGRRRPDGDPAKEFVAE